MGAVSEVCQGARGQAAGGDGEDGPSERTQTAHQPTLPRIVVSQLPIVDHSAHCHMPMTSSPTPRGPGGTLSHEAHLSPGGKYLTGLWNPGGEPVRGDWSKLGQWQPFPLLAAKVSEVPAWGDQRTVGGRPLGGLEALDPDSGPAALLCPVSCLNSLPGP